MFLGWMDTFNHGSCLPLVPTVGHSLPLGDLEASCRESISTDDGNDATAIDCPAAAMPVALVCVNVADTSSSFCDSDCYDALAPYLEECSGVMPGYMNTLIAGALALAGSCTADEETCDMTSLVTTCATAQIDALGCEDPCLHSMSLCRGDPTLSSVLGPHAPAQLDLMEVRCDATLDDNPAGDGQCDLHDLLSCGIPLDAGCARGDVVCMCTRDCIKEYMDCVDNPRMHAQRNDILLTIGLCRPDDPLAGSGAQFAGDGRCNVLSANHLCEGSALAAIDPTTGEHMGGKEMCESPCVQEMLDCADSPALAPQHRQVALWQSYCGTKEADCLPVIADMGGVLDATCCSGAGLPSCTTGPPQACVTGCAAMYMPFWSTCGQVLADIADARVLASLSNFNSVCEASHPQLVPRPLPPPPSPPSWTGGGGH